MNQPVSPERRVWIPRRIEPQTLRGIGSERQVHPLGGETMGTEWTASVALPPGVGRLETERVLLGVFGRIIEQMSPWRADSDLSRFNQAEPGSWHVFPREFFDVLQCALRVAKETAGAYNPAIGRAIDLLGFGPTPPHFGSWDPLAFQKAFDGCGWLRIEMEAPARRVRQPGGIHLDLGSIAKGYAVDCAAEALKALGCADFLIEIGGEVRAHGCKPDGQPWWCQLQSPDCGDGEAAMPETIFALCDSSLASSGNSLRCRWLGGRWHGHIVHGIEGALPPSSLERVFVLHPECILADAYATALYVFGSEQGIAFANERNLAALFVQRRGASFEEVASSAWEEQVE